MCKVPLLTEEHLIATKRGSLFSLSMWHLVICPYSKKDPQSKVFGQHTSESMNKNKEGENSKLSGSVRNIFYAPNLTDRRSDGGMRVVIG